MALVSLKGHDKTISETKRQKTRTINQENLKAISRIKNLVRETGKGTGKKKVGCFPSDCLPWIPLLESPNNQLKKKCAFPCGSAGQCLAENGILYGQPKHSPDISLSLSTLFCTIELLCNFFGVYYFFFWYSKIFIFLLKSCHLSHFLSQKVGYICE